MRFTGTLTENLPEQISLVKHFLDVKRIDICYESIKKQVSLTKSQEISEDFLDKNLLNSNFSDLLHLDFQHFDFLLRNRRKEELNGEWTDQDFIRYKKNILRGVTTGEFLSPIILNDLVGKYFLFSGEARMLAYKVLGIHPVVKVIHVDCVLNV